MLDFRNKVSLIWGATDVPMSRRDTAYLHRRTDVLASIAGVDLCPSGAIRIKLHDLAPGATSPTTVAAYVWADHVRDFNRFMVAVREAGLDRVSGGGVDLVSLRESWECHRAQIEHAVEQATRSLNTN
jgi:hypothetical protein